MFFFRSFDLFFQKSTSVRLILFLPVFLLEPTVLMASLKELFTVLKATLAQSPYPDLQHSQDAQVKLLPRNFFSPKIYQPFFRNSVNFFLEIDACAVFPSGANEIECIPGINSRTITCADGHYASGTGQISPDPTIVITGQVAYTAGCQRTR